MNILEKCVLQEIFKVKNDTEVVDNVDLDGNSSNKTEFVYLKENYNSIDFTEVEQIDENYNDANDSYRPEIGPVLSEVKFGVDDCMVDV